MKLLMFNNNAIKALQNGNITPSITTERDNTNVYHPVTRIDDLQGEPLKKKDKKRNDYISYLKGLPYMTENRLKRHIEFYDKTGKIIKQSANTLNELNESKTKEDEKSFTYKTIKRATNKLSEVHDENPIISEAALLLLPEVKLGKVMKPLNKILKSESKINRAVFANSSNMNTGKKLQGEADALIENIKEVQRKIYFNNVTHPENIKKIKVLDAEASTPQAMKGLNEWVKKNDYNNINYDKIKDKIKFDELKINGLSKYDISLDDLHYKFVPEYLIEKGLTDRRYLKDEYKKIFKGDNKFNEWLSFKQSEYMARGLKPIDREIVINKDLKKDIDKLIGVMNHELKHNINSGGAYISKEYSDELKTVFKNNNSKDVNSFGKSNFDYFTKPTEFQSYIGTNFKDELVDLGIIDNVHSKITPEVIKKADEVGSIYFNAYKPYITDLRKFIKMTNKTPYSIAGAATLYGANKMESKKEGGLLMFKYGKEQKVPTPEPEDDPIEDVKDDFIAGLSEEEYLDIYGDNIAPEATVIANERDSERNPIVRTDFLEGYEDVQNNFYNNFTGNDELRSTIKNTYGLNNYEYEELVDSLYGVANREIRWNNDSLPENARSLGKTIGTVANASTLLALGMEFVPKNKLDETSRSKMNIKFDTNALEYKGFSRSDLENDDKVFQMALHVLGSKVKTLKGKYGDAYKKLNRNERIAVNGYLYSTPLRKFTKDNLKKFSTFTKKREAFKDTDQGYWFFPNESKSRKNFEDYMYKAKKEELK